jgi:Tol biopolymer transport system component
MREYDLDTRATTRVYTNEPGMGPILNRMPHYPLWSPDSSILSIMASESLGLTLLLAEPGLGTPHDTVIRNSPLYAGWSSDSSRLLVHAGAEAYVVNVHEGKTAEPIGMGSGAYHAPAWRAGSNQVALVSLDAQGQQELTVLDVVSGDSRVVQPVVATVAFSWSPDGSWLAVGETSSPRSNIYNGVRLVSWDGSRSVDPITGRIVAFFWSPNSQYIAYVTAPDDGASSSGGCMTSRPGPTGP